MDKKDKRFVIQEHRTDIPEGSIHWDFMLETGEKLETYRLDKPPREVISEPANAFKIFDHSAKFLAYEGAVNKDKGLVSISDCGTYRIVHKRKDKIEVELRGEILKGHFILEHIEEKQWRFGKAN